MLSCTPSAQVTLNNLRRTPSASYITAGCQQDYATGPPVLCYLIEWTPSMFQFFILPALWKYLPGIRLGEWEEMLKQRQGLMVSGQSLGTFYKIKMGIGKKAQPGMKRRKSEKTFYWYWCWTWQLPLSKNKLPMAVGQDADIGTCQRQTAEVAAALVKWAWRPQGAETSMPGSRLPFSAGSLLKQGLWGFPTPLGWVSEQSEVQVAPPTEQSMLCPGRRRSSPESPGSNKGMPGEDAADETKLRRGSSGTVGWSNFLLGD